MSDDTKEGKEHVMMTLDDYRSLVDLLKQGAFILYVALETLYELESPPDLDPNKVH